MRRLASSLLAVAAVALVAAVVAFVSTAAGGSGAGEERAAAATAPQAAERERARYRAKVSKLTRKARTRMRKHSWRPGCPVPMRKLRSVAVTYWNFKGKPRRGRLVVHRNYARGMAGVFRRLWDARFRVRKIKPIDAYRGSDHRSMAADNTSAFNCRYVSGTTRWSNHAYGKAIDINPRENPYVTPSGYVSPPEGAPYRDRKPLRKGMIGKRGPVVGIFRRVLGWQWGGNWKGTKDFQHFSWDGR